MSNHLTPQQILSYLDGELPKPEMRRTEKHLHSCWTCLTEVERLKSDIAIILDAEKEQFDPALPPPPKPWASVESLIVRSLPELSVSPWTRLAAYMNTSLAPVRFVLLSCVVAALVFSSYSIFGTRTVSAKEVLRRIEVADKQRSAITKGQVIRERVHVRKTLHGQSHPQLASIDTWESRSAAYWSVLDSHSPAAELEARYNAHNIPVGLPLSSASVDSWGKAAGGDATVSRQGANLDVSFAGSGNGTDEAVERVSLLVQPETWQVKQMTLDFVHESFEVTEDDYVVMPTNTVPAALLAYLEPSLEPSSQPKQPAVHPLTGKMAIPIHLPLVNLDKAELDVLTKLHDLRADLGEPVTLTRSSQAVQVGIWELPPERQSELSAAFANQAGVEVLVAPPSATFPNSVATSATMAPAETAPMPVEVELSADDQGLLKFFGSVEREQYFTDEALRTSTAILSHLYALRNLQRQFPVEKSHSLARDEKAQLNTLVQDHATTISMNLDALAKELAPVDANFHVAPCTLSVLAPAASWQMASMEALETARAVDHLLRAFLTASRAPAAPDSALPEIDQNLCRLRAQLNSLAAEQQQH